MKIQFYSFSLLFMGFYACNTGVNETKSMQDSVIAVHDQVMPQMGDFIRSSMEIDTLLSQLPALKAQDSELDTLQARIELTRLKGQLDQATESMNDWMHAFEVTHEGKSTDEIKSYLEQELVKIKEVQSTFETASTQSTAVLEKYSRK